MKRFSPLFIFALVGWAACTPKVSFDSAPDAVDYVDVQAGLYGSYNANDSLREALPIIQLPNALLRISPLRESYKTDRLYGFSLFTPTEGGTPLVTLLAGKPVAQPLDTLNNEYIYDEEKITPYSYSLFLPQEKIEVNYTLASTGGLYNLLYNDSSSEGQNLLFALDTAAVAKPLDAHTLVISTSVLPHLPTRVHFYIETAEPGSWSVESQLASLVHPLGQPVHRLVRWQPRHPSGKVQIRYGISLVSVKQAQANLRREIATFEFGATSKASRNVWQNILRKVEIEGGSAKDRSKFYTALYKSYLYPTQLSEGDYYYSPVLDSVMPTRGKKIYAVDHTTYTYETTHPLHLMLTPDLEREVMISHIEWIEQLRGKPSPIISPFENQEGDAYACLVQIFSDAYGKGLMDTDPKNSYAYIQEYVTKHPQGVNPYDLWCLGLWAEHIGKSSDAQRYKTLSLEKGKGSTQLQAHDVMHLLEYNDARTYPIAIHYKKTVDRLMRSIPTLQNITPDLLAYAYSYYLLDDYVQAQKYSRLIIDHCFGNDFNALPGKDHYGALSSSLAFAMMGLFPVAPGVNAYMIGVPLFSKIRIKMERGSYFEIAAPGASQANKYSTEMDLNGKPLHLFWLRHSDIAQGGKLMWRLSSRLS